MRLILLGFNELSPPVIRKLTAAGEQPNFKRANASLEEGADRVRDLHGTARALAGHGRRDPRQLASERRSNTRWRRTVLLDRLQCDLFRWYWKRAKPVFSTFFLNSTAHYQHIYWRHMDSESFEITPDPADSARSPALGQPREGPARLGRTDDARVLGIESPGQMQAEPLDTAAIPA